MLALLFASAAFALSTPCDEDGDAVESVACGGLDCHDLDAEVHPGAPERCNGVDDNCDGRIDEGLALDADGDGFFAEGCGADPLRFDCDDSDPAVFPQFNGEDPATIGVDDDCDGLVDEEDAAQDDDEDGYCEECPLFDCNDSNPAESYATSEDWADGADNDCQNGVDDGDDTLDEDADGFTPAQGDCNDDDPRIGDHLVEICDGIDNNCDGELPLNERDLDGDGVMACEDDCDDADPARRPRQAEVEGNAIDDNCDGRVDEVDDADGDGAIATEDCDDDDASVFPGAVEVCDGVDQDCDGLIDETFDLDLDGFTSCGGDTDDANAYVTPARPPFCATLDEGNDADGDGWTTCRGDCDDTRRGTWPGALERDNGIDDDCDGLIDEGLDADGDGFTPRQGDCDDSSELVGPRGIEVGCNAVDDDCLAATVDVFDADGDGAACDADCDDAAEGIGPSTAEVCGNGVDEDCSGADEACEDTSDTGAPSVSALPPGWFCQSASASGLGPWFVLLAMLWRRRRNLGSAWFDESSNERLRLP